MAGNSGTAVDFFTWWTVVKFAFTTGLFTAAFTQGLAWAKETVQGRTKTRRQGKELSFKLVDILTAYAQECLSRADSNNFDDAVGEYARFSDMPELPLYPNGEGWAVLPGSIAGALSDLRNEVTAANRHIDACGEINGYPEAVIAANRCFVDVGHLALRISERLRKHYKFGRYQSATSYQFAKELRRRYREHHRSLIGKVWHSLPIYRLRQTVHKRWLALIKRISNTASMRGS